MSIEQILRLTPDDDMASLRQRLQRIAARTIILIVPDDVHLLRSAVSARLLRRYAEQMDVHVVLISRDRQTEAMARQEGLPVYSALRRIPSRYRAGLTTEDIKSVPGLPSVPIYRWLFAFLLKLAAPVILAAGGLTVALVVAVLLPEATIRLAPATEDMTLTISLIASPQIRVVDSDTGQLPAKAVQVLIEDTGQVATTGRRKAPDAHATGSVVFASRGGQAVTIPKGTIVRTATGVVIRFRTEEDAVLSTGTFSTVRVPIKAVEPGPTGNVKAGAINTVEGTLAFQVSVINDEPTSGGSEKEARFVTLRDRDTLRTAIVQTILTKAYAEMIKAIQPDDILPQETLTVQVNVVSFDKPLDAVGDFLTGRVLATVSGLVLEGDDIKRLVAARLRDQVSPGFVLLPEGVSYSAPSNVGYSDGVITLQITATAHSRARIDVTDVRRAAAGKAVDAALLEIEERLSLARPPQVELNRAWFGLMPFYTSRINVIIEDE